MKKNEIKKIAITIAVSREFAKLLRVYAAENGVKQGAVVEQIMSSYIGKKSVRSEK